MGGRRTDRCFNIVQVRLLFIFLLRRSLTIIIFGSFSISSSASVPELQNHMSELESRVSRETRRRLSLEDEVRRLTDENKKLREQAQSAVLQLRKFTEWFFKNVQRQ